jgi:hypothetical protein
MGIQQVGDALDGVAPDERVNDVRRQFARPQAGFDAREDRVSIRRRVLLRARRRQPDRAGQQRRNHRDKRVAPDAHQS